MSAVCPGLVADFAAESARVFLGTQPTMKIEKLMVQQLQSVYPWYASRKRIKEQANEFLDADLLCDAEVLMRYSHVFFLRHQLFTASSQKQLTTLEKGKPPVPPDIGISKILGDLNDSGAARMNHELEELNETKQRCVTTGKRELEPSAPIHFSDLLCMMRVAAQEVTESTNSEVTARMFLPQEHVSDRLSNLKGMMGFDKKSVLEKKDVKLLNKLVLTDYNKVGSVDKMRPLDVAAFYRFCAERTCPNKDYFTKCLWGNMFRLYASNATYLRNISLNWAKYSSLDESPPHLQMPMELAEKVVKEQRLFPGTRFRLQYAYCNQDFSRQLWRTESFVPLARLYPLLGKDTSEDLLASVLCEGFWMEKGFDAVDPLEDKVVREVKNFVGDCSKLREESVEALGIRAQQLFQHYCPPHTPKQEAQEGDAQKEEDTKKPSVGGEDVKLGADSA